MFRVHLTGGGAVDVPGDDYELGLPTKHDQDRALTISEGGAIAAYFTPGSYLFFTYQEFPSQ